MSKQPIAIIARHASPSLLFLMFKKDEFWSYTLEAQIDGETHYAVDGCMGLYWAKGEWARVRANTDVWVEPRGKISEWGGVGGSLYSVIAMAHDLGSPITIVRDGKPVRTIRPSWFMRLLFRLRGYKFSLKK